MSGRTQKKTRFNRQFFVRALSVFLAILIVGGTLASLLQIF